MARRLVVGNWKMNLGPATGLSLVQEFLTERPALDSVDAAFCVPFPLLAPLRDVIIEGGLGLGAQDVFWKASGAFTGFVSAGMLKEVGATHVI
ncbi:triose-phosphate isomerase, partial [bacterium]